MRSARAKTDEEKAALLERLLDSWKMQPRFRLGQLLKVQIGAGRYFPGWEGPEQG